MIGELIDIHQLVFIKNGENFIDILAEKILFENSSINLNEKNGYIIIIDQEKDYNTAHLGYLFHCLEKFGVQIIYKISE
ncbi:hypothetical protein AYI68_g438 [Smittium mucronatum]|uniref:Uncharacterized protein n=1 Tax=Smittium mucronatum TaxID=133383 RepID=A0A1R0H865_9FUNG|nr:hypothetical protein AYI68_g438 [Smittium mucronatum]